MKIAGSAERSGVRAWRTTGGSAGEVREFSWFSHEGGVSIDHAASGACGHGCWGANEHAVRESGVSDHAALVVEISETA